MQYSIENDILRLTVDSHGAEPVSVIHKPTGADRNNLRDLRLLLSGRCEDEAALRSLFYLDEFHNDAV